MRKHSKIIRLAVFLIALAQIAVFIPLGGIVSANAVQDWRAGHTSGASSDNADDYLMRARDYFKSHMKKLSAEKEDPNEVVRVIVETEDEAVIDSEEKVEYDDETKKAEASALKKQLSLIEKVEKMTGSKVINRTAYLVNGFSIEMKRSQMAEVEKLDGVKSVYEVTEYEQQMDSAIDMTTATDLWSSENGAYTGEGIVIAIIDSGVNYEHPDMVLSTGAKVKFTKSEMQEKIDALGYGKYYTEKVPFGYSYGGKLDGDVNNDAENSHGLHVSGIAAANGKEIKGVAPNAQLFAMQVFSNSGSAYTDDIIKAVEDSVKLGADIINLSLGSGVGFYNDADYLQRALEYAEEQGVICCVAAGNDGISSSTLGDSTNDWGMIDTGLASRPSTFPGAISVASVENISQPVDVMDFYINGELYRSDYPAFCLTDYRGFDGDFSVVQNAVLVDCGLGDTDEFDKAPADTDWVAVIKRGTISFEEKITNAHEHGAAATIIYNNETSDVVPSNISAGNAAENLAIAVSGNFGAELVELADKGSTVSLDGFVMRFFDIGGGMSVFSSWGPTPTLDIKPEISAPGGMIYSTSAGEGYELMSGTSMASPYIAGSSAIILQSLKEAVANGELKLGELALNKFVKMSMMNTANPVFESEGLIYPVRQQGAGMVDQFEAANNRVIATYNGIASAALGEVTASSEFVITLTNYGTADAVYTLPKSSPVYVDITESGTNLYHDALLDGASVTYSAETVTVPANGTATVTATLTLGGDAQKQHFVEAYVTFDGDIDLSLPVLGFYGDWDEAGRIVDEPWYETENGGGIFVYGEDDPYIPAGYAGNSVITAAYFPYFLNYYGTSTPFFDPLIATGLMSESYFLGIGYGAELDMFTFSPDYMAFSPNSDGIIDHVQPSLGMLRSAALLTVDILDGEGNVIRRINTQEEYAKTTGASFAQNGYLYNPLSYFMDGDGTWDGTVYNSKTGEFETVPDGQYYVRVGASLPGSDKVEYTTMPVKVDTSAPKIEVISVEQVDEEYLGISFSVDDFSGAAEIAYIFVNGEIYPVDFSLGFEGFYDPDSDSYYAEVPLASMLIPDYTNEIVVISMDHAGNEGSGYYYTDIVFSEDEPVVFTNIDVYSDPVVLSECSYLYSENADGTVEYKDIKAVIRGCIDETVDKLVINDTVVSTDGNNFFSEEIPVQVGRNHITVTAYDADGAAIYSVEFEGAVDLNEPEAQLYVTDKDHSGEWCTDMLLCSYKDDYDRDAFATKYKYGDTIPVAIEAHDETLVDVTVTWLNTDINSEEADYIFLLLDGSFDDLLYEISPDFTDKRDSVTLSAEDLDENGRYTFDIPMTRVTHEDIDLETELPYEFTYEEQYLVVKATDAVGNEVAFSVMIVGGERAEEEYAFYGDSDLRDQGGEIPSFASNLNFTELLPLEHFESYPEEGVAYGIVTSDMVTKVEGLGSDDDLYSLHLTGTLTDWISGIMYEGEYTSIPGELDGGTWKYSFDVLVRPGTNIVYYTLDYLGELLPIRMTLYFIPDGEELSIAFKDDRIDEDAVIYTNKTAFDVEGTIYSLIGFVNLKINGEQLIMSRNGGVDVSGGRYTDFSYAVPLDDGENIISVELYDDSGCNVSFKFTVYFDSEVPVAPKITSDGKGNVTITSDEEGAVIYYSTDGENWTEYKGTFALEASGNVYAKTVDKAGNESDIAVLSVNLPSPPPTEPSTPSKDPVTPPQTGDESGIFCYVFCLALSAIAVACLVFDKRRSIRSK